MADDPHQRQTVPDLICRLLIGYVLEGVQDEEVELANGIQGRAAPFCPLGAAEDCRPGRPKRLPGNNLCQLVSGIALFSEGRIARGDIKKSKVGRGRLGVFLRRAESQSESDLSGGFRDALYLFAILGKEVFGVVPVTTPRLRLLQV